MDLWAAHKWTDSRRFLQNACFKTAPANVPFVGDYVEPDHIANYYVRGDVVSSVGTHIGPSYELIPVDPTGHEVKLNWGGAHALATFLDIVRTSAALGWQMPSVPKAPKQ